MKRASVKLILKENKKNALGKMPIYLRITVDRKTSQVSTGHFISKTQWDERAECVRESNVMYEEINRDLFNRKRQVMDELLQASIDKRFKSAATLKKAVSEDLRDVFKFTEKYQKEGENRKSQSTLSNYKKHFKKLEEYVGARELYFDEIDADYLRGFEAWLRKNIKGRDGRNPNNYIAVIMRTLRAHFNEAVNRGITSNYPFNSYQLPNETPGNKDFLSISEIKKWHTFAMETEHPTYKQTALYFLFGCYTGLRLSDWKVFTEGSVRGKNISLKATKNKAWVAVPLHKGLIETIAEMKRVPLTLREQVINRNLKTVAEYLKIPKHLSTHSGRRTFAVTMCLERGVSSETAAELMGITLAVFVKNYSFVTPQKIEMETAKAWADL